MHRSLRAHTFWPCHVVSERAGLCFASVPCLPCACLLCHLFGALTLSGCCLCVVVVQLCVCVCVNVRWRECCSKEQVALARRVFERMERDYEEIAQCVRTQCATRALLMTQRSIHKKLYRSGGLDLGELELMNEVRCRPRSFMLAAVLDPTPIPWLGCFCEQEVNVTYKKVMNQGTPILDIPSPEVLISQHPIFDVCVFV